MINLNTLAKSISEKEGGDVNLSIAQIKEVLSIALDMLAEEVPSDVLKLLEGRVR